VGVYRRADSPYWWMHLEHAPSRRRRATDILVGVTAESRKSSRADALKVYHAEMAKLGLQKHGLEDEEKPASTFRAFAAWYDAQVIVHKRGKVREREILATLNTTFGDQQLTAITLASVLEWRTLRAAATSASTANRETAVLKHILKTAVPTYLPASPIAGLKPLRPVRRETHVLTFDEERKLLKVLTPVDRAIVVCALDTLMRLSDVVNLRRDQDRGSYIVVEDPKVQPYRVPVSSRLRKLLDGLKVSKGAYYFPSRRNKDEIIQRSVIKNMLTRACAKAGIDYGRAAGGITFHGLRHTGTTRMVDAGVPLRIVQELGGWKSMRQLERYAHPTEAAKVAAVETIGRRSRRVHSSTRK
jgi:integrase